MHNLVGLQRLGESIEMELFREGDELNLSVMMQPIEINEVDGERMSNLHFSIMKSMGIDIDSFADSEGVLKNGLFSV